MSFANRRGGVASQDAGIKFIPQSVAPASDTTADAMYDRTGTGLGLLLRDKSGVESPVVEGADGAGVKAVTFAMSPYAVLETDRLLLVNTTDGAVSLTLPAAGGPKSGRRLRVVDAARNFAVANCTLNGNGNNVNAAATLVLATQGGGVEIIWGGTTWERSADVGGGAPGLHATTHQGGGSDDIYTGNTTYLKEVSHTISVAASTTVSTAGGGLSDAAAAGSPATAGAAGGAGGARQIRGGIGGAGHAAQAAGAGGALSLRAANAGADAGGGGAAGGSTDLDAGSGTGAGAAGTVGIGTSIASEVNIGKSSNKIGHFGVGAVVQPATTGEAAGFTAGAGAAVLVDSTFTGNSGTKAYTVGDIVKHLKALGLLAGS